MIHNPLKDTDNSTLIVPFTIGRKTGMQCWVSNVELETVIHYITMYNTNKFNKQCRLTGIYTSEEGSDTYISLKSLNSINNWLTKNQKENFYGVMKT